MSVNGFGGADRLIGTEGPEALDDVEVAGQLPDLGAMPGAEPDRRIAPRRSGSFTAAGLEAQLRARLAEQEERPFDPDAMPEVGFGKKDSPAVETLQSALNEWRVRIGERPLRTDGDFGKKTKENVEHFQAANGLPVTGFVDRDTWRVLADMARPAREVVEERPTRGAASFDPASMPAIERDSKDTDTVRTLQRSLDAWRATRNLPPVGADGHFGAETADAVKHFQRLNGISPADGKVNQATWERLAMLETRDLSSDGNPVTLAVPWIGQLDRSGRVDDPGDKACFRTADRMVKEYLANNGLKAEMNGVRDRIDVGRRERASGDVIETRADSAENARVYIDRALDAGLPTIVGVSYKSGSDYNWNKVTDHFVVITGRGVDENGRTYYTYNDPATPKPEKSTGRFYVDDEGKLDKAGKESGLLVDRHFEVSEVRTWKELP